MSTVQQPAQPLPRKSGRDALCIIAVALALCLVYALLCPTLGWKADFAESNFQSNLLRIENYLFGPKQDAVLVGSSVTGRLLPKYFADQGWAVANLGLDGSGTSLGLEITRQRTNRPSIVLAEVNALFREPNRNDALLRTAIDDPSFALARGLPICRAELRPSALLYSAFKSANDRRVSQKTAASELPAPVPTADGAHPLPPAMETQPPGLPDIERNLRELQSGGAQVVFLRIPAGSAPPLTRAPDLADWLIAELGCRQIEAITLADSEPMIFTDGLHLTSKSAATVSRAILKQLPLK